MELQVHQFWILKDYSTINSTNEYEPNVIECILCNTYLKIQNLQRIFETISALAT